MDALPLGTLLCSHLPSSLCAQKHMPRGLTGVELLCLLVTRGGLGSLR